MNIIILIIMLVPRLVLSQTTDAAEWYQKYKLNFENYTEQEITASIHIVPYFTHNQSAAGVYDESSHRIYISSKHWSKLNEAQKYWLMYHEMYHSLGVNHHDTGIMAESLPIPKGNNWAITFDDFRKARKITSIILLE